MTATTAVLLQAPPGATSPWANYIFPIELVLIMGIFYFLMIRPQQKQRKQHEQSLKDLKKGDEVVTAGGIVGRVIHVKETVVDGTPSRSMDDRVTIESGESRLVVERGRITKILGAVGAPPKSQAAARDARPT